MERSAWCEATVSPIVAQDHRVIDELEQAGVLILQAFRPVSDTVFIHVIRWEELPQRSTDDRLRLVVIADRAGEVEQREAARRGAAALIAVDRLRHDFGPVISCVTAGYYPMPYGIAPALVSRLDVPPTRIAADELAVLEQLLQGATTIDIADALGCSERHARRRLRAIWDNMGVSSRREGLTTAVQWGLGHEPHARGPGHRTDARLCDTP